jgi:hypothetical protein
VVGELFTPRYWALIWRGDNLCFGRERNGATFAAADRAWEVDTDVF